MGGLYLLSYLKDSLLPSLFAVESPLIYDFIYGINLFAKVSLILAEKLFYIYDSNFRRMNAFLIALYLLLILSRSLNDSSIYWHKD